jgi:hypothetical protein
MPPRSKNLRVVWPAGVAVAAVGDTMSLPGKKGNGLCLELRPCCGTISAGGTRSRSSRQTDADADSSGERMKTMPNKYALTVFAFWANLGAATAAAPTVILDQPASQQVYAGSAVGFDVLATGVNLRYQWMMNGTNLPAQTNSSLILSGAQPANTGSYSVNVLGAGGTVLSSISRLEVNERSAASMPVALSGWNEYVIVSPDFPYVSESFDDFGYCWFESGFNNNPDGLPASGSFTSAANPGVIFQFQSYLDNNVLRLDAAVEGTSGILTLATPAAYKSLSILASCGDGSGPGRLALNFVDGTASPPLSFAAYDWFTNSPALAIAGLGRVYFDGTQWDYENGGAGFGMFETDFDLAGLGLAGKKIAGISFAKSPTPQVTGVFAVSGVVNSAAPPSPPPAQTVTLTVSGVGDLWLAGMTNGATASGGDTAPYESPTPVTGLLLQPGKTLSFLATGAVGDASYDQPDAPEGNWSDFANHLPGPQNGIANILAPIYSLLGVFLGPEQPSLSPTPSELDFAPDTSRDYGLLRPALKQVFFIGDGLTSLLAPHHVVIPHDATRLFLGVMDTELWAGNQGSLHVSVSEINPVSLAIAGQPGGGVLLTIGATPAFTNLVQSLNDLSTTNWTTLTSVTVATSPYQFADTNSGAGSMRFNRVIQLP